MTNRKAEANVTGVGMLFLFDTPKDGASNMMHQCSSVQRTAQTKKERGPPGMGGGERGKRDRRASEIECEKNARPKSLVYEQFQ